MMSWHQRVGLFTFSGILMMAGTGEPLAGSEQAADRPQWVLPQAYRLPVQVEKGESARYNAPVGVAVDFRELLAAAGIEGRVDRNSIRVVRYDPAGGDALPYHGLHEGDEVPYQLSGDFFNDDAGMIWWRLEDENATDFHIYFDTLGDAPAEPPAVIGLIGVGDTFHYNHGRPGFANATGLHSYYWHIDFDGDGLRDLIGFGYRRFEHGAELPQQLGNAVYFYKNIGTAEAPLFAPRQRVKGEDGEYLSTELLAQNMFPIDFNGDGRIHFYGAGGAGGSELLFWENTGRRDRNGLWILRPPRVIGNLDLVSDFRASATGVSRPARFWPRSLTFSDWAGDGIQRDLIVAYHTVNILREVDPKEGVMPYGTGVMFFELWRYKGTDENGMLQFEQPVVIRDDSGMIIRAHSVATGGVAYVDWTGDGRKDLLFHDKTNTPGKGGRLMFAENVGTRQEPVFILPTPIAKASDSPFVVDWNGNGRIDLIAGSEFFENINPLTGGTPDRPVVSRTEAGTRKPHAWSYPRLVSRGFAQQIQPEIHTWFTIAADWDGNGVLDLISGQRSHLVLFRNRGTNLDPVFDEAVKIEADGEPIYMPNYLDLDADPPVTWGPQGPSEGIYGWTLPYLVDFTGNSALDLFVTGQRWQVLYFENIGTREQPVYARGRELRCEGDPHEFSWRSRVAAGDLTGDGRPEIVVTSDSDNIFWAYTPTDEQDDPGVLNVRRAFPLLLEDGEPVRGWYGGQNNNGDNHVLLVDWTGNGLLDLINGTLWAVWWYENVGTATEPRFRARGKMAAGGQDLHTFRHAGSFHAADFSGDGRLDLMMGAECPSDQPHGSAIHLFDRAYIEGEVPQATMGDLERWEE